MRALRARDSLGLDFFRCAFSHMSAKGNAACVRESPRRTAWIWSRSTGVCCVLFVLSGARAKMGAIGIWSTESDARRPNAHLGQRARMVDRLPPNADNSLDEQNSLSSDASRYRHSPAHCASSLLDSVSPLCHCTLIYIDVDVGEDGQRIFRSLRSKRTAIHPSIGSLIQREQDQSRW